MKYSLIFLIFLIFLPATVFSIEIENRLPASIWHVEIHLSHSPAYSKAFNGYGKEAPLQHLILWDRGWYDLVEGEFKREEQRLELRMAYGLNQNWMVEATVPMLQKNKPLP